MQEEQRWKEQLHAGWTTPDPVVEDLVRRATGSRLGTRSRIVGGEGNEVWAITTRAGDDLILRVLRVSPSTSFAAEQWATEQARRMGVPVPEILLVDDAVAIGDQHVAVWIHRTIHGQPLWTVRDEQMARCLTAEAGEMLAQIHAVPTEGSGMLDAHGHGRHESFSDVLAWDDQAADSALANGISRANVEMAARLLDDGRRLWLSPRLLHGDWLQEHILVQDDAVAGIIDFGGTRGGYPAYDIAYWRFFWDTEHFPVEALLEGYQRAADPGPHLDQRVHLCRIGFSMRAMGYYTATGRSFPAQHAARRFAEALTGLCTAT